jgi:hypothetical protein
MNKKIVALGIMLSMFLMPALFPMKLYAVTPFEQRVNNSIESGLQYLRDNFQPGGYWVTNGGVGESRVAGASLGVLCFMEQKDPITGNKKGYSGLTPSDKAIVDLALAYIVSRQQLDGSIWYDHKTYETGLAMSALAEAMATGGPDYTIVLSKAINFFVVAQADEGEGLHVGDTYYGGWGYEGNEAYGDDSNTQFALIGLRAADNALGGGIVPSTTWDKAILFVQHCQNDPTINEMAWAQDPSNPSHNDGGCVYVPDGWSLSDVGYYGSTGSHTALGCWNYILCGLLQTDYRVGRTLNGFDLNYDYDENPNEHGWPFYYYYAWSFSKAMRLTSPASDLIGGVRDPVADGFPEETASWYYDFAWYLTATQHVDGSFYNNPKEGASWVPNIDTMFAILVLEGAIGVPMADTVTTYTGDTIGYAGRLATLSAVLTEKKTGAPIGNEPIIFTLQGKTVSAVTGSDGVATATMLIDPPAGVYTVTATFPGDISKRLNPSSDSKPFTVIVEIAVHVDIKPGSWPNPINVGSKGVFTVAICGTKDFNVKTISATTVKIYIENIALGVSPIRWSYGDVATPYTGLPGGGWALGADGYLDLVFQFDTPTVVSTLGLAAHMGQTIPLIIKGNLNQAVDGTPIKGQDYVWIFRT